MIPCRETFKCAAIIPVVSLRSTTGYKLMMPFGQHAPSHRGRPPGRPYGYALQYGKNLFPAGKNPNLAVG